MSGKTEKKMRLIFYLLLAYLSTGCVKKNEITAEKPLARVLDHYLYMKDLTGVIPHDLTAEDSTTLVKDFIEKWVRNQLVLSKAELNLTEEEKNVELQIENYRSSLLIYAYEQSYLRQNLDTVVTNHDMESYFKENQSNFILNETMMKGSFIKIPVKSPEVYKVRQWYRSENPENIKNLEAYCFKYGAIFDHFNDGWVKVDEVWPVVPGVTGYSGADFISRKYLEARDSSFYYFLNAKEIAASGTVSPYEIVKNDIYSIILNKRKIKLINELESSIYSDAQNREYFTIYP